MVMEEFPYHEMPTSIFCINLDNNVINNIKDGRHEACLAGSEKRPELKGVLYE